MAISFDWRGYAATSWSFVVGSTNVVAFFGSGGYGSPIQVGQYNDTLHIRTSISDDTDSCSPPHLTAVSYHSSSECLVNGSGPTALTAVSQQSCLKIQVKSDTDISIIGSRLYAYDGSNVDNPPSNITFKAFKHGDASWSQPHGRTQALNCGTRTTPATEHDFYLSFSISPTSTGASSLFVVRFEVDIQ